ncbi:MAG TPA: hypothetical protein PK020_12735 [Ilumatobacteraceae bacterium]|nr:hypothetical protein [Ilumatobacteraceae bacterium]HRB04193.1 hypothetical protein [Ilumatobacteraceae bacterium]
MQQRNKLIVGFTTIVLSGTLAFGAIASATGNDNGGGRKHLTTQERCDKVDDVEARAADAQGRIADRVVALQERRAAAEANGETDRVERLDRRLARLDKISTRLTERLAKVEAWAAANCVA